MPTMLELLTLGIKPLLDVIAQLLDQLAALTNQVADLLNENASLKCVALGPREREGRRPPLGVVLSEKSPISGGASEYGTGATGAIRETSRGRAISCRAKRECHRSTSPRLRRRGSPRSVISLGCRSRPGHDGNGGGPSPAPPGETSIPVAPRQELPLVSRRCTRRRLWDQARWVSDEYPPRQVSDEHPYRVSSRRPSDGDFASLTL